jgi:hypothetical protein
MSNTDIAGQVGHVALSKYVANKAVTLALAQPIRTPGNDAGSILTAVLHNGQCVIQTLTDRTITNDSCYATHLVELDW